MSKSNSNIHSKERSILSVVFFGTQLQIQEQHNFGGPVHNQHQLEIDSEIYSADYFNSVSQFLKEKVSGNWHKAFILIPTENHLLVPNIFYADDQKENLFEQSHLEHSGDIKSSKPVNTNSTLLYSFSHKLEMFLHNNFPGLEIYSDVHWLINHCMLNENADHILAFFDEGKLKVVIKKDNALQIVNSFDAENSDELVYYLGYVINAAWPNEAQNLPIDLHANEERLNLGFLKTYFPKIQLHSTSKQSTMIQLLSECV